MSDECFSVKPFKNVFTKINVSKFKNLKAINLAKNVSKLKSHIDVKKVLLKNGVKKSTTQIKNAISKAAKFMAKHKKLTLLGVSAASLGTYALVTGKSIDEAASDITKGMGEVAGDVIGGAIGGASDPMGNALNDVFKSIFGVNFKDLGNTVQNAIKVGIIIFVVVIIVVIGYYIYKHTRKNNSGKGESEKGESGEE